jgi:hypothetical protein
MSSKSLIAIGLLCAARPVLAEHPPPSLGNAASFAVLASTVTSSGPTVVTGNLGGKTIHGFPQGVVLLGTTIHDIDDPLHDTAAAYEDLSTRTCDGSLQGHFLAPHIYCSTSPFTLEGTLTLDAHNDPNAVWIFQICAGFTADPGSAVRVINGGWEGNVFWQVNGQAVIGEGVAFIGNILASKGITFNAGASLSGRALVVDGAVTLSGNNVSLCCKQIEVFNPLNSSATVNTAFIETFTQKGGTAPVTFSLASGTLPVGFELTANGTLSGKTSQLGTFPITVRAADATHCTGTSATYVLTVSAVCAPITITNPVNTRGIAGVYFKEKFEQTRAVEPFTFTASNLPKGLTIEADGTLHGVPTQTGVFPITVAVTGANNCSFVSPIIYILTIDCQAITVIVPTNTAGTAGVMFFAQFGQTGAIGTATYTLASGTLPPGLALSSSGVLSGTTNQTGRFPITVTVTDDNCCTGTSPRYTPIIGCQKITVIPPITTTGTAGTPLNETFMATGILGTATFSYSGTLPSGVTLINGILDGTPTQTGCFTTIVTATDTNGCTGTTRYTLCIGGGGGGNPVCPPIVASPSILPPAVNMVPYAQPITVTGGTPPYSFTIIGGSLPAGLTLTPASPSTAVSGMISGIPTVSADINVVIRITDAAGCSGDAFYYPPSIPALSPGAKFFLLLMLVAAGMMASRYH